MEAAAAAVALATTGIFTGGVVFISAIQLPAAIVNGYNSFWSYFNHMYPRGFKLQGAFACLGTSAAAAAAVMSADKQAKMMWALSGALMFAVFPYTMVALMPHTKKIMRKEEKDPRAQEALLRKWGQIHHGRTVLALASFALMTATVVGGRSSV